VKLALPSTFRPAAITILLVMAGVIALGVHSIRRDIQILQEHSRDNILWSATQKEIELLRFQKALASYAANRSEPALASLHERFDILISRFALVGEGRVGEILRNHDAHAGTLGPIKQFLEKVDPVIAALGPETPPEILDELLAGFDRVHEELRFYSLEVVRAENAVASMVRSRLQASALGTGLIALGALAICVIALILVARDAAHQRDVAAASRRQAREAKAASEAKSRFLTMMSHELRNPLNGILGPIALLGQTQMAEAQQRLLDRAQQSGRIMSRMLRGLLDYGDIQDRRLVLRREPLKVATLAAEVEATLADFSARPRNPAVRLAPGLPEMIWGDGERIAQVLCYLGEYVLAAAPETLPDIVLGHDGARLVADVGLPATDDPARWTLHFVAGRRGDADPARFATESLGPAIAQELVSAMGGLLSLSEDRDGRRAIRVMIPAEPVRFEKIRVHAETRSAAMRILYQAALKSDRIEFVEPDAAESADIVLVDSTSTLAGAALETLRARFPRALFVSMGLPLAPGLFDEVVERPTDMECLRSRILARLTA
jgi:signal transduction histidine kinase